MYVRIGPSFATELDVFTPVALFCFLPLCAFVSVLIPSSPFFFPPMFFSKRSSNSSGERERERESVSPLWMYTYSRSLCLNSSLGKPDNAGEKCFPCGLMLVDPRCLAAWMGGSHLEERDLEAPFKGIAGRWWSVGQAKFHLFSLPV